MAEPTPSNIEIAEKFLNETLNAIGIKAVYKDDVDFVDDGFQFFDQKTGDRLSYEDLRARIQRSSHDLCDEDDSKNYNEIIADRLSFIIPHLHTGDTGWLTTSDAAVIDDQTISNAGFQNYAAAAVEQKAEQILDAQREKTGACYQWHDYFDVSHVPQHRRETILIPALNWLEQYSTKFHDVMRGIHLGQQQGLMKGKIGVFEGLTTHADLNEGKMYINLTACEFYIGQDLKIHEIAVQDDIIHEGRHFAQLAIYPNFSELQQDEQKAINAYRVSLQNLEGACRHLGVPEKQIQYYTTYAYSGGRAYAKKWNLDPKIFNDDHYQWRAKAYFERRLQHEQLHWQGENDAVSYGNDVRTLTGRALRGHYEDLSILQDVDFAQPKTGRLVFIDSPEVIRARGHKTYELPSRTLDAYPLLTGDLHDREITAQELQDNWNDEYNPGSKNVNETEWRVIQSIRDVFYRAHNHEKPFLSDQSMRAITQIENSLIRDFNQSKSDIVDPVSSGTRALLDNTGLDFSGALNPVRKK